MISKLYVGNFPFATTAQEVQELFSTVGTVTAVDMIFDKFTGRPRGFGFVTMASPEEAKQAVEKLNGHDIGGRKLTVTEARPMTERPSRTPARGGAGGDRDSGPRGLSRGSPRNERNYDR